MDRRALVLFRVAIGALLLADLALKLPLLETYYTDQGILPTAAWSALYERQFPWRPSFHALSGSALLQYLLFAAAAVSAVALMFGRYTRAAAFASWLLLTSLQNRNPIVLIGADPQLRLLLFFGAFLPWSEPAEQGKGTTVRNVATWAYAAQISLIYLSSVLLKTGAAWREDGSAIYYALSFQDHSSALGRVLLQFPELLSFMTPLVLAAEAFAVFVPFVPADRGRLRTALVAGMIGLHFGFILFLNIGLFPFVSMAAWIPLLPPWFFDRFGIFSGRPAAEPAARRRWAEVVCAFSICWVVVINVESWVRGDRLMPRWMRPIGELMRLDQRWNLFAPAPRKDDGWYVVPAMLENGTMVDAVSGRPVSWDRPDHYDRQPVSWLWYLRKIRRNDAWAHRRLFAEYLCSRRASEAQISELTLTFVLEKTPPPGEPAAPPVRQMLLHHSCRPESTAAISR